MEGESVNITGWVSLAVTVGIVLYAIIIYNNLVTLKHSVEKAWSNIDVLLKQRHDELPKLVDTCREYMKFEQETLEKVMMARAAANSARESGDVKGVGQAESAMRMGLGKLFALAENYPELKANESFNHLQARITSLEDSIADRREFYNESVYSNNVRIEQFPDIIVARLMNFGPRELLEFEESELADVDVGKLFGA